MGSLFFKPFLLVFEICDFLLHGLIPFVGEVECVLVDHLYLFPQVNSDVLGDFHDLLLDVGDVGDLQEFVEVLAKRIILFEEWLIHLEDLDDLGNLLHL